MMIVLAVLLVFAGLDSGSQRTIVLPVLGGYDRVTFDPAHVSEKEVRRWMQFSPNISNDNYYLVPESLELCIEGDPEYKECGTRDWRAKNFAYNANVNLQKIRKRIRKLDEASYPPELRGVVSYVKKIQQYVFFYSSQLLKFVQDLQTANLAPPFNGIEPGQQCSAEIVKIRAAPDKQTAYKLAYYEWWTCVNGALRTKVGEYPEATWKEFLRRHSIREEFIEEDID